MELLGLAVFQCSFSFLKYYTMISISLYKEVDTFYKKYQVFWIQFSLALKELESKSLCEKI